MSESTEIEKRPVALGAPMTDLDSAFRLAKNLAVAALMPDALRGKPSDVLAIMLYGQDLGLSPMQAIQGVYVVKGKPHLSGTTWIALARQRGHNVFVPCLECGRPPEQHPADDGHAYVPDHDAAHCTITVVRGDNRQQHTETFTIEDARTAKLLANDIWTKYPKRMLLWRAAVDCLRFIAPEIALGFYTEGEDIGGGDVGTVVVEQVADEPVDAEVVETTADAEPAAEADEVSALAAQFDFAADASTGPAADYACICGAVGQHFEDECPQAVGADA